MTIVNPWRAAAVATGLTGAVVALGMTAREPWATALWPWPDHRMTFAFIAAQVAALAAAMIWIGASGQGRAAAPVAAGVAAAAGAMAIYLVRGMPVPALNHATVLLVVAPAALAIAVLLLRRFASPGGPPMPVPVRAGLAVLAVALGGAGVSLWMGLPHVLPWPAQRGSAILLGCVLLGDALALAAPVLLRRPPWLMAVPPLLGLLVQAAALAVPMAAHAAALRPENRAAFAAGVVVMALGAALAAWSLFIARDTRRSWLTTTP